MARKLSRQAMLGLLNSVGEDIIATIPFIAQQAGLGEGAVRKKAKKALDQGALSPEATNIWRGWLHLNGPVAAVPQEAAPHQELLGEEVLVETHLPEPLPEAERVAMGDEPLTAMQRNAEVSHLPPEEQPELPSKRRSPKRRRQTALWLDMTSIPISTTYDGVLRTYMGTRTVLHPEWQLRRYIMLNPKLPDHVRNLVLTHITPSPVTGEPIPEPVSLPDASALANRVALLETRADTAARADGRLSGVQDVLGREVDMIIEELNLTKRLPGMAQHTILLFLPRLTYTSVHRMLKASQAFLRVLFGRESSGTRTGGEDERY